MKFNKYITELAFGTIKDYQKLANYYVGNFGRGATHKFLESRPPMDKKQAGWQAEEETRREVYKLINKLLKKLGV